MSKSDEGRSARLISTAPVAALGLFGVEHAGFLHAENVWVALASAFLLLVSVFAAVHHAELVALKVGEPFGSVLLALAVTMSLISPEPGFSGRRVDAKIPERYKGRTAEI